MNPTASTGYSQGTFASGADPTETSPWFAAAARQWPLIAVAIACFAPIIYGLTGRLALDRDPYIYAQIGREMLEGKSLYDETWMDKPPLTYVLYAIPQVIFPRSIVAISVFAGIVIAVQGLMFAWAFRNCALAAICCLLFLTLYPQTVLNFAWASTEHFSNVFVAGTLIIALSIFRERKFSILQCVTVGALAIAAFHVRQNAVFCAIVPATMVLLGTDEPIGQRVIGLVAMAVGGLLAWLPILAFVAATGDLDMYFWTVFVYPKSFARVGSLSATIQLVMTVWTISLPLLVAAFTCFALTPRNRWFVALNLAVGIGICMITRREYAHYWSNSLPFVAVIIGLGMQRLLELDRGVARRVAFGLAAALVVPACFRAYIAIVNPTHQVMAKLAAAVDAQSPEDATLLVCGPGPSEAIQFASRLKAASMYEWMFMLRPPYPDILPKKYDQIVEEYLAAPPGVIVVHQRDFQAATSDAESTQISEDRRLVRALLERNDYQFQPPQDGYLIGLLSGPKKK